MAKKATPKFTVKEIAVKLIDNNTGQIKGVPENPRTITKEDFQNLKKSIKDDPGFLQLREPLVYPLAGRYVAIAGNQRIRCLRELPIEFVTVKILDKTTPVKDLKRWAIKDNTNKGEWDIDLLANEWDQDELAEWGFNSFDEEPLELSDDVDDVPSPPKTPVSKPGDLWLLGDHRVLCGDATDASALEALMGDTKADMVFTDPPYNVDYTGKTKDALKIDNDSKTDSDFLLFLTKAFSLLDEAMHPGAAYYICHADSEGYNFRTAVKNADWELKQCLIWNKNSLVMGRQDYQWKHEPILYGWKPGAAHYFVNDRKQTTVWDIDRPSRSTEHPTMKPVELIARAINNSSKPQQIILDTFLGSGSTLIACEETNRQCYGIELDPQYVDVICKRWQTLTGEQPILQKTKKPRDFIGAQ